MAILLFIKLTSLSLVPVSSVELSATLAKIAFLAFFDFFLPAFASSTVSSLDELVSVELLDDSSELDDDSSSVILSAFSSAFFLSYLRGTSALPYCSSALM
jgi:hypothetical protein